MRKMSAPKSPKQMKILLPQCALIERHYASLHAGIHYCIKIGSFLAYFSIEESFRPPHAKARVWSREECWPEQLVVTL